MPEQFVTKADLADAFEQLALILRRSDAEPSDPHRDGEPASKAPNTAHELPPATAVGQTQPAAASARGRRSWIRVGELGEAPQSWSSAERWYDVFEVWETDDGDPRLQLGLGYVPVKAGVEYYGRPRGYWIVHEMVNHRLGPELAVFVEAERSTDYVAVIRGNGPSGRSMFDPGDNLPTGYEHLTVGVFRDHVVGPQAYGKLAVIAEGGDRRTMLDHGAIQWAR